MSRFLDDAIDRSKKRAAWSVEMASRAVPAGGGLGSLSPVQSQGLNVLNSRDDPSRSAELAKHFSGWVHSSVRPIAQRVAGQPIRVARVLKRPAGGRSGIPHERRALLPGGMSKQYDVGQDVEILERHELLDTLNDPNAAMVRWALVYVTVVALNIVGKAYWWLAPRNQEDVDNGAPKYEIWPVPASWVEPIHEPGNRLFAKWRVKPPGQSEHVIVDGSDMAYFFYPDFTDPFGSYAPLEAHAPAAKADEYIVQSQLHGFKNGINPGWILTVGKDAQVPGMTGTGPRMTLTPQQRAQIIHFIRQHYRGFARNQEPMILDSMIESAVKATMSPVEMDYSGSGNITKSRITQGFGTNPIIMGEVEGANRASAAAADDHFCNFTVNPIIELISETATAWIGAKFAKKNEKIVLFIEPARAIDVEFDLKASLAIYDRGGVDLDYLRMRFLGLPPIAGGHVALVNPKLIPYELLEPGAKPPEGYNPFFDGPKVGGAADQPSDVDGGPPDPTTTTPPPDPDRE